MQSVEIGGRLVERDCAARDDTASLDVVHGAREVRVNSIASGCSVARAGRSMR